VTAAQIVVTASGVGAIAWVLWYFLGTRRPASAPRRSGMEQEVRVVVKGGYTPDTIVVQAGKPVQLRFYRDETADCSGRVVFPAFGIDVPLPAFETTTVEFTPTEAGEFPFRCGMDTLQGLVVVEAAGTDRKPATSPHKFHDK